MKNRPIATPMQAFAARVLCGADCWGWNGSTNKKGYGTIRIGGRGAPSMLAHRLSWELNCGLIPDGLQVLHACDNPPCTRPDHLFLGTNLDNIRDRMAKGRPGSQAWKGKPSLQRRFSDADIAEMRGRYVPGTNTAELCEEFGISLGYFRHVVAGDVRAGK